MEVSLISAPTEETWLEVKQRAFVTMLGDHEVKTPPSSEWKHKILEARHSPIRRLWYSFYFKDIPSWVSVHFCRHVHAQPYVSSQRNDRQKQYDRNKAPQDSPVNMILDVNAEELMVIANKRLCTKASAETRDAVREMCRLAIEATPELNGLLVPMCFYHGMKCHEMQPCGMMKNPTMLIWETMNDIKPESP